MKKQTEKKKIALDECLECFGEFHMNNIICRKYCALSLRCIIERDQNSRIELLEDLLSADTAMMKVQ